MVTRWSASRGRRESEGGVETYLLKEGEDLLVDGELIEVETDRGNDLVNHTTVHRGHDLVRHPSSGEGEGKEGGNCQRWASTREGGSLGESAVARAQAFKSVDMVSLRRDDQGSPIKSARSTCSQGAEKKGIEAEEEERGSTRLWTRLATLDGTGDQESRM